MLSLGMGYQEAAALPVSSLCNVGFTFGTIKYLFEKPALTGRLARWVRVLSEFDLKYVTRKSVKGRAVAEFLADHPVEGDDAAEYLFPDEAILHVEDETWTMYFDGASNQYGYGIGVLLIAPDNSRIPLAFKL